MAAFDPYHKWLGIPPAEQPPNHYRLLGLTLFESDLDVIDVATEQRVGYLRQCATGERVAESQKLLNEVAAARLCLVNAQKKRDYDAKLQAKPSSEPSKASAPLAAQAESELNLELLTHFQESQPTKRTAIAQNWRLMGGVALIAVVLIYGGSRFLGSSSSNDMGSDASDNLVVQGGLSVTSKPDSAPMKTELKELSNRFGMKLLLLPAGEFRMGSPSSGAAGQWAHQDEQPEHLVRLKRPFYMSKYETTVGQYEAVMQPGTLRSDPNSMKPIANVDWYEANEFCRRLSQTLGTYHRLPTEAEWEYACRARSSTLWSFGDGDEGISLYAWCNRNSGSATHDVGLLMPNAWGLQDMHGNVAEWCRDWYSTSYYSNSTRDNPPGAESSVSGLRVHRGGSCDQGFGLCRSAFRGSFSPDKKSWDIGFRVVLEVNADGTPTKYIPGSNQFSGIERPPATSPVRPSYVPASAAWRMGHWYWVSTNKTSFANAEKQALAMKGRMVVISNQVENNFVASIISGPTWLGINRVNGKWMNSVGRQATFFNWDVKQPSTWSDEKFAAIHPGGKWHDYRVDSMFYCVEWGDE